MSAATLTRKRGRRSTVESVADLPPGSRAAVYARISLDLYDGATTERQIEDARKRIEERGWLLDAERDVFADVGISSDGKKVRPAFDRLLDALATGYYDVLVVFSQDRLTRQTAELELVANACIEGDVLVESLTGGRLRLDTPEGRLMARTIGNFAQYEREHMGDRLRAEKEAKAYAGAWTGGRVPYGYRLADVDGMKSLAITEESKPEAARVRHFVESIIAGRSLSSLADEMNRQGVPAPLGGVWHYSAIRMMVSKPLIAGRRTYHGEDVGKASWEAIVPHSQWLECMSILSAPGRKSARPRTTYLLTGFVYSEDGDRARGAMTPLSGELVPCYRAKGATVPAELVDDVVVEAVLRWTDHHVLGLSAEVAEDTSLDDQIAALDDRLAALAIEHEDGELLDVEFHARRKRLVEKRAALVASRKPKAPARPARAVDALAKQGSLRALWREMDNEMKREVLSVLIDRVVLHGRYAERRVTVEWHPDIAK